MENKISALNLPQKQELGDKTKSYFAKCQEKLGMVPNVLQAYSFDETKLNGFTTLYNDLMLGDSNLSKLEREMIAVVVSSHNKCYYCLTAHGAAVRQLSKNPELGEQLVMNYRAADLNAKHKAMLDFAIKVTIAPEDMEEEDRQDLREQGFNDYDIWDISAVTAFFNMTNRMASAIDMRPNSEYHSMAR